MNKPNKISQKSKQKGVGLLEVLITALVLAVGLLGMAALQIKSSQYNQSAYIRSQANILAYDIADRMRANKSAALLNSYNITLTETPGTGSMATTDLSAWKTLLSTLLPSGKGSVSCNTINTTILNCSITVTWREPSQKSSDADLQLNYITNI